MDEMISSYAKRIPMEDSGRTDKDDLLEQPTIIKNTTIIFFTLTKMSELLLPPEHRYAKNKKEQLNEDGSELILNLGPTHQLHTVFFKISC
jgi:hypothetical protein